MNLHIDNDTCHEIIFTQGGVSHSLDKLYYNEHLVWEKQSQHDYSQDYFTIESLEDNNDITFVANGTPPSVTLYYSTDDGATWSSHASSSSKLWVLNTGDKLLFKAEVNTYSTGTSNYWSFTGTKTHNVYGNIMSLIYGDNFAGQTILPSSNNTFCTFFKNDTQLLDASHLILPATTLTSFCYISMFAGCTSLTNAPELPATTLGNWCYSGMFNGCTSLVNAPTILPALTLTTDCYSGMFNGCTSLVDAPVISAQVIGHMSCNSMFRGCTALVNAPELSATTLDYQCYAYMFEGCTSLVIAPELPATTLASGCYGVMFQNCTSLKKIVCLATDISAGGCTTDWVNNVSATGDFYKADSMSSWTTGTSGIPSGWTVTDYTS